MCQLPFRKMGREPLCLFFSATRMFSEACALLSTSWSSAKRSSLSFFPGGSRPLPPLRLDITPRQPGSEAVACAEVRVSTCVHPMPRVAVATLLSTSVAGVQLAIGAIPCGKIYPAAFYVRGPFLVIGFVMPRSTTTHIFALPLLHASAVRG